jgi:hemerythrin
MPEKIIWTANLETGIADIDNQHRHLVDIINTLTDSIGAATKETLIGAITELKAYAEYHFQAEEGIMETARSPYLPAHRGEHQAFIDQVTLFDLDVILASDGLAADMLYFLRNWLTHHILQEDKKFVAALGA